MVVPSSLKKRRAPKAATAKKARRVAFDDDANAIICDGVSDTDTTVIFEIITFLIQKHFKTVTVTVILGKLIQMIFKTVIGNQWKWRGDCGRQDGNGNGNSSEFQDGNGNGNLGKISSQE